MPRSFSAPIRRETLAYQNQSLHYTLVFRSRRTIGFAVRPDGSVHISAPAGTSPEWVAQQVLKKPTGFSSINRLSPPALLLPLPGSLRLVARTTTKVSLIYCASLKRPVLQ